MARAIFALPEVEVASHTFSHPFDWLRAQGQAAPRPDDADDSEPVEGDRLDIPGYTYSLEREIDGSVRYIDGRLAPIGKPTRVMLWSGNALPPEEAIARADALGLANLNGDNAEEPGPVQTLAGVPSFVRPVGDRLQFYAPAQNENVYTNLWHGPYYGFRRVIDYFRFTDLPRRLKPIGIYYHFYSGTKAASVSALHEVYAWALAQETFPLWVSELVERVKGFEHAALARRLDGTWLLRDFGALRTVRLPAALGWPDLERSPDVAGVRELPQGRYVALAPTAQRGARAAPATDASPDERRGGAVPRVGERRGRRRAARRAGAVAGAARARAGRDHRRRLRRRSRRSLSSSSEASPRTSPRRRSSSGRWRQVPGAHCDSKRRKQEKYMSSAVDARPRVIRPGVLALLALAVGSLLALLFPGLDFGHPKYLGPPDELSIAYLEQVLRTHPEDRPARLLLARQQRALGHWDAAETSLRLLAGGGDRIATEAEIELFELSRARLDALMPADPERPLRQQQSLAALRLVDPILLNARSARAPGRDRAGAGGARRRRRDLRAPVGARTSPTATTGCCARRAGAWRPARSPPASISTWRPAGPRPPSGPRARTCCARSRC